MKLYLIFAALIPIALQAEEPEPAKVFQGSAVVADKASLALVSDGFKFTEGPARDAKGDVYFTDQPNDRIHRWIAETGKVELFLEPAGRSNGLCFDPKDGALIACA